MRGGGGEGRRDAADAPTNITTPRVGRNGNHATRWHWMQDLVFCLAAGGRTIEKGDPNLKGGDQTGEINVGSVSIASSRKSVEHDCSPPQNFWNYYRSYSKQI